MTLLDFSRYALLLEEALSAYQSDPSYAMDMARQANALIARVEARRDKVSLDIPSDFQVESFEEEAIDKLGRKKLVGA